MQKRRIYIRYDPFKFKTDSDMHFCNVENTHLIFDINLDIQIPVH